MEQPTPIYQRILSMLRSSPDQEQLRQGISLCLRIARGTAFTAGGLIAAAVTLALLNIPDALKAVLVLTSCSIAGWLFRQSTKQGDKAVYLSMVQDRIFFTQCLRAATTVEELEQAGLWGWLHIDADAPDVERQLQEQILEDVERLRGAVCVIPKSWAFLKKSKETTHA